MYNSKSVFLRPYDFHSPHSTLFNPPKRKVHDYMFASRPAFPGTNISIKTADSFDLKSFSSSSTYLLYQKNSKSTSHERVSLLSKIPTKRQLCPLPPDKHSSIYKLLKTRPKQLHVPLLSSPLHSIPPLLIHRKQSSIGHVPIRKHTRSKNRATTIL
jgi:hypothetical protein